MYSICVCLPTCAPLIRLYLRAALEVFGCKQASTERREQRNHRRSQPEEGLVDESSHEDYNASHYGHEDGYEDSDTVHCRLGRCWCLIR